MKSSGEFRWENCPTEGSVASCSLLSTPVASQSNIMKHFLNSPQPIPMKRLSTCQTSTTKPYKGHTTVAVALHSVSRKAILIGPYRPDHDTTSKPLVPRHTSQLCQILTAFQAWSRAVLNDAALSSSIAGRTNASESAIENLGRHFSPTMRQAPHYGNWGCRVAVVPDALN